MKCLSRIRIVRENCWQISRCLHVLTLECLPFTRSLSTVITVKQSNYHRGAEKFRFQSNLKLDKPLSQGHIAQDPELFISSPLQRNITPNQVTWVGIFPNRLLGVSNRSVIPSEWHRCYSTETKNSSPAENKEQSTMNNMNNQLNQAKNIWRKAEAVCFDVDSTVIQDEAIDELAKFCGKGDEVEELTREAMKGGMDFRQALALRLDLIRPRLSQVRNYILSSKLRLSPYVKELINELHKRNKEVYLVSGGFRSIIIPLAQDLHIPTANVYANKLKFFYDGDYAGFDENQMTSRTGGKGAVIRNLKEKHGYETVVMVGDGITDWEAAPPADLFIGFGGNAYRNEVKSKAKWYVTDFRDLINELRD